MECRQHDNDVLRIIQSLSDSLGHSYEIYCLIDKELLQACVWDRGKGPDPLKWGANNPSPWKLVQPSPLQRSQGGRDLVGKTWLSVQWESCSYQAKRNFLFFATIYLTGLIFAGIFGGKNGCGNEALLWGKAGRHLNFYFFTWLGIVYKGLTSI